MVWIFSSACHSKVRLDGKTAVVTGANVGIGKETARDLASRGASVILAVRDVKKGEEAVQEIRKKLGDDGVTATRKLVRVERLDLGSLRSVRECAARLLAAEPQIHILVNNAGVMACPRALTEDGFETHIGVNHLGHFLLTLLLLPTIRRSGTPQCPARIVNVASIAYIGGKINFDDLHGEKSYTPAWAYAQSKLANILFTRELAKRLQEHARAQDADGAQPQDQESVVRTYAVHPGVVATELMRHLDTAVIPGARAFMDWVGSLVVKTPRQGAQTSIYCAVDERAARETGLYYSECKRAFRLARAKDDAVARRLWDVSVDLCGIRDYDPFQ